MADLRRALRLRRAALRDSVPQRCEETRHFRAQSRISPRWLEFTYNVILKSAHNHSDLSWVSECCPMKALFGVGCDHTHIHTLLEVDAFSVDILIKVIVPKHKSNRIILSFTRHPRPCYDWR